MATVSALRDATSTPAQRFVLMQDFERHDAGVHQNLTCVLEINGHAVADRGLHLPYAPVWAPWVTHALAGFDRCAVCG